MRPVKLLLGLVVTAALLLLLGVPSASASNLEGCTQNVVEPCFANNRNHGFSYDLGSRLRAATERTRTQTYETTVLTTVLTDHSGSDVAYSVADNVEPGVYGYYECRNFKPSDFACDHAHIVYHGDFIAGFSDSDLQALACHETGHSFGLRHPLEKGLPNDGAVYGCMIQAGYPGKPRFLGQHNADHINNYY